MKIKALSAFKNTEWIYENKSEFSQLSDNYSINIWFNLL